MLVISVAVSVAIVARCQSRHVDHADFGVRHGSTMEIAIIVPKFTTTGTSMSTSTHEPLTNAWALVRVSALRSLSWQHELTTQPKQTNIRCDRQRK